MGSYCYNSAAHAVNKFQTPCNPRLLAQTFAVNSRSTSNPLDISPVMMLKPTNQEPDLADRRPIGKRTQSAAFNRKGKTSRPASQMVSANQSGNKAK